MKHEFLCLKEAYSLCFGIVDLTIPLLLLPYFMCFDNTTWPWLTTVMTRLCNSLTDGYMSLPCRVYYSRKCTAGYCLVPCVNFVISACLTIPDQYSFKEFFAFRWTVASFAAKDPKPSGDLLSVILIKKCECRRRWERKRRQRRFSVTMYRRALLKHSRVQQ